MLSERSYALSPKSAHHQEYHAISRTLSNTLAYFSGTSSTDTASNDPQPCDGYEPMTCIIFAG